MANVKGVRHRREPRRPRLPTTCEPSVSNRCRRRLNGRLSHPAARIDGEIVGEDAEKRDQRNAHEHDGDHDVPTLLTAPPFVLSQQWPLHVPMCAGVFLFCRGHPAARGSRAAGFFGWMRGYQRGHQAILSDYTGVEVRDFVGAGHEGEIEPAFTDHDLRLALTCLR